MKMSITELYYLVDEFCKLMKIHEDKGMLPSHKKRNRSGQMSVSEMLTIMIYFHLSGYKCFKNFYLERICGWYSVSSFYCY
jgi:hypothetical protein